MGESGRGRGGARRNFIYRAEKAVIKAGALAEDMVFPRRCPMCHDAVPFGKRLCPGCVGKLPYVTGKRCAKCSQPVEEDEELCDGCRERRHVFDRGLGVFIYEERMKEAVSYMKYRGRREYCGVLGELAGEAASGVPFIERCGVLVPVPIHASRLRERGYNQAELIARAAGRALGKPVEGLLVRKTQTAALKNLHSRERYRELSEALEAACGAPKEPILVVDDIFTSGATVDAAADALKRAGAPEVYFLTVCIGAGYLRQY